MNWIEYLTNLGPTVLFMALVIFVLYRSREAIEQRSLKITKEKEEILQKWKSEASETVKVLQNFAIFSEKLVSLMEDIQTTLEEIKRNQNGQK